MRLFNCLILVILGLFGSVDLVAQKADDKNLKDELKQINKRILAAFPDLHTYSKSAYFESPYKAKLLAFTGCNIKFLYSVSFEKVAYDDYVSFSLSAVLIERSSFRVDGPEVTFAVNTDKDKISAQRSTGGVSFTGELPLNLHKSSKRSSFSITLKTDKNVSEVQNDFGRAIVICKQI